MLPNWCRISLEKRSVIFAIGLLAGIAVARLTLRRDDAVDSLHTHKARDYSERNERIWRKAQNKVMAQP